MAYLRKAVVKMTLGGFFSALIKSVPKSSGIFISRKIRSTGLACKKLIASIASEQVPASSNVCTEVINFFNTSRAGGSSSTARHTLYLSFILSRLKFRYQLMYTIQCMNLLQVNLQMNHVGIAC